MTERLDENGRVLYPWELGPQTQAEEPASTEVEPDATEVSEAPEAEADSE